MVFKVEPELLPHLPVVNSHKRTLSEVVKLLWEMLRNSSEFI
jgi:hypothetical protein